MDILIDRCAGLDVHKRTVVACIRAPRGSRQRQSEIRTFTTETKGLLELADWLTSYRVTHVAMESTGVYWRPVYQILEGGFELLLVNARHIKNVPGRKTDVRDCEWIGQLLECGLLRSSFVPPEPIRDLRDLTRYRKVLIRERGHHVNRIAKTLEMANIKLGSVATDIMGKTGRAVIEGIIEGVDDAELLAERAEGLLKKKKAQLAEALAGKVRDHHRFILQRQLQMVDDLSEHIAILDDHIEEVMRPFAEARDIVASTPGIATRAAEVIVSEIGDDMNRFPTAANLCSWAHVCPGTNESAGKKKQASIGKGNSWLRATLHEAAWAAARTKNSYYSALYRRLKPRLGSRKAIVAVEHAMLRAIWHMLKHQKYHEDLGVDYFERNQSDQIKQHHLRRLEKLGYDVQIKKKAA